MAPVSTRGYLIYRKDENGNPTDELLTTREEIAADSVQVAPIAQVQETNDGAIMRAIWDQLIYTHNQPDPDRYDEYVEDMLTQRNLADVVITEAMVEEMVSDIGSNAEIVVLEACGHSPLIDGLD